MLGDLVLLLKLSNNLEIFRTRSSDFWYSSRYSISMMVFKNKSMFLSTTTSHNHRVGLKRWRRWWGISSTSSNDRTTAKYSRGDHPIFRKNRTPQCNWWCWRINRCFSAAPRRTIIGLVSKDGHDDGESQAPPQIIGQSLDTWDEIIRYVGKIGSPIVTGGAQEQIDVSQHQQVAQSPGWSHKMDKTMGDLNHLRDCSNDRGVFRQRWSDIRYS
jgi:hypothetical protein